jgi:23S rRNA (adenine2503-C2)-methyltransferase
MNLVKIAEVLEKEPIFRLKQVKKAIFFDLIKNWDEAFTLPQNLRQQLSESCPLQELKAEKILTSKDDETLKVLFKLKDYNPPTALPFASRTGPCLKIESVLMKHEDGRRTVCVSCQVGCSIGCKFCATGQQGFKRNLSSSEIIDQVLFFARLLKKSKEKVTNVVFMGMGEPFLNYDNVLEAIKILNDKEGFNLGVRHISISTVGITEGIEKLAKEKLQVNLAISLHAPNNELRTKLMPINKVYPLEKILTAVGKYIKKTKRRVMFEYLMIDKANDSEGQAEELAQVLKKSLKGAPYFVNLISYNPIGHSKFKPSPGWKIKKFKEILERAGIATTQRYRFGKEIKAACGQLAGRG